MHYSKEEKAMWLKDWKQSGKSAWAYAKENGLIPQTFYGWTKKEISTKQDLSRHSFVEIPALSLRPSTQVSEILIEKGEIKIHIPLCINRSELQTIMEVLGRAS